MTAEVVESGRPFFDFVDSVAGVMVGVPSGGEVESAAQELHFIVGARQESVVVFQHSRWTVKEPETHIKSDDAGRQEENKGEVVPGHSLDLNGIEDFSDNKGLEKSHGIGQNKQAEK